MKNKSDKINVSRKLLEQVLSSMDSMLNSGEWYCAQERADALREALDTRSTITEDVRQIAEVLRRRGLTLVKTGSGYQVREFSTVTACVTV